MTCASVNRIFTGVMAAVMAMGPLLVSAQRQVPALWGMRVHDEAHVLSPAFVSRLEQRLKAHEDSTSNQIAVLIVPSLEGEILEEYTLKVAEEWKLGTEGNDNGVLLFIAINDRKVRIEVGEGLEGPLPDVICNQIIRNEMAPYFRQGSYEGGVDAAITSITQAIAGEYKIEVRTVKKRKTRGSLVTTLLILLVIIIINMRNRGNRRRGGGWIAGPGWFGGYSGRGGGGWSGGGGFMGGGGGFSGGGSSGSW